jgi:hypothetical protein
MTERPPSQAASPSRIESRFASTGSASFGTSRYAARRYVEGAGRLSAAHRRIKVYVELGLRRLPEPAGGSPGRRGIGASAHSQASGPFAIRYRVEIGRLRAAAAAAVS